jgi:ketosteroid isomerase-like protein
MGVSDLNQLASSFAQAVTGGDLDALCAYYDEGALFVTGPGTEAATGVAAIREVMAGFLSTKPVMEFERDYALVRGDLALLRGKWKLTSRGQDGAETVITGSSVEVAQRGADGLWRYVIDHPWGAD